VSGYKYELFESSDGFPMWACYKREGGIAGYGYTMEDALSDFLDKQEELVPVRGYYTGLGNPEQPPEFVSERGRDDE
jgi:hypothetical protein